MTRREVDRNSETPISIRRLNLPDSLVGRSVSLLAPVLDRLLGLRRIDEHYRTGCVRELPPFEFARRALEVLGVRSGTTGVALAERVPASGPLLIVCNHPFGAVEALVIAHELASIRAVVKFLANAALKVFPEFAPLLIPTNPLRVSQANLSSIRRSAAHLRSGGILVVFPAGRVSFYQRALGRIADGAWNRVVGHLALRTEAPILPVFFEGSNRPLFHFLGSLWDRAKILLLPREMLALRGQVVRFRPGRVLPARWWRHLDVPQLTRFARLMVYAQAEAPTAAGSGAARRLAPLAPPADRGQLADEIRRLPDAQRLLDFRHFSVFFASAHKMPIVMSEIARERERTFRALDEGSGDARDGDRFDETYVQLFAWDNESRSLVGAYRLGRVDQLRARHGMAGLYLSQMFHFDDRFYDNAPPSLELGRSFVVPEHQKSFHALYLLWQGIGRYLCLHPQYRRLYGTVSLTRQYDDRAIAILCDALIAPTDSVRPRHALKLHPHPEWLAWRRDDGCRDLATISGLVRSLDDGGKDVPVLLKHYYKLNAKFHCVAVDPNFSDTPGLLLSVDIPALSESTLRTFLGAGTDAYLRTRPVEIGRAGAAGAPGAATRNRQPLLGHAIPPQSGR